jgi:hypothetical protein
MSTSKRDKARGEFVWVNDGVGVSGQYPAQLVIPMKEMNIDEMKDDDVVEVRFTTSGRYEWVKHSSIEYPDPAEEVGGNNQPQKQPASIKWTPTRRSSARKRKSEDVSKIPDSSKKKSPASSAEENPGEKASRKRSDPDSSDNDKEKDANKKPANSSATKRRAQADANNTSQAPAKRQKTSGTSMFENLTAPFVDMGKTIAIEITGFYNGLFGRSSEGK